MRVTMFTLAALAAACAGAEAGVDSIANAPEWRLAQTPRMTIGVADGDERYMFTQLQGAMRLANGHILLSDTRPPASLFDSTGVFVKRLGARGSGPGEYRVLFSPPFAYRGDSIALFDPGHRRFSVFDVAGLFGRSATVAIPVNFWPRRTIPSQSCCHARYAFRDGSFLLEFPSAIPNQPGPPRVSRVTFARVAADGSRVDTIGTFNDRHYRYDPGSPSRVRAFRLSWPFEYTMIGDTIIGGNGEAQWLLRISPGAPPDTIRLSGQSMRVTDSIKDAYGKAWRDEQQRNPERFEGPASELYEGEYMTFAPAYNLVLSDASGNVWLGQWKLPFSPAPWEFHVYTTRGRPLARVKLPARANVAYIGVDEVALIESNADDVSFLRIYTLIRSATPR